MMLEAVEARFGAIRVPEPVEWLSDNGSPYTARDTRLFAAQLNLTPCFTPIASPESQVLRLLETFEMGHVHGAIKQALGLGAIGYDAVNCSARCGRASRRMSAMRR